MKDASQEAILLFWLSLFFALLSIMHSLMLSLTVGFQFWLAPFVLVTFIVLIDHVLVPGSIFLKYHLVFALLFLSVGLTGFLFLTSSSLKILSVFLIFLGVLLSNTSPSRFSISRETWGVSLITWIMIDTLLLSKLPSFAWKLTTILFFLILFHYLLDHEYFGSPLKEKILINIKKPENEKSNESLPFKKLLLAREFETAIILSMFLFALEFLLIQGTSTLLLLTFLGLFFFVGKFSKLVFSMGFLVAMIGIESGVEVIPPILAVLAGLIFLSEDKRTWENPFHVFLLLFVFQEILTVVANAGTFSFPLFLPMISLRFSGKHLSDRRVVK